VGISTDGGLSALDMDDKARERQRELYEYRKSQGIAALGETADVFNIAVDYIIPHRLESRANELAWRG
jgi:membrane dipeptidase